MIMMILLSLSLSDYQFAKFSSTINLLRLFIGVISSNLEQYFQSSLLVPEKEPYH